MRKASFALLSFILVVMISSLSTAADFAGKKVLFIDSYHQGYPWSDGITQGVRQTLDGTGIELKVIQLDTKRNKGEAFKKDAALKAKAVIESFKPDVVIAADDNASKYLIKPYYKDAALPFVFCGVNWEAANYGFPYSNVTGMVEVAGVKELLDTLKPFAKGDRIALLSDDTTSSRKNVANYKNVLGVNLTEFLVADMAAWKAAFKKIQGEFDLLIVDNVVGINDFDAKAGEAFAVANAKIPSGAVQGVNMPYALLGYLKVAEEQGEWSANAALKILGGTSPADIPIAKNKKGSLVVNAKIMAATGVELPYELIESADKVIE
jgi:ABC-type uncharacterized transport system substrate-binding protein